MLIPKGQTTVPLRVQLKGGKLSFLVRGTCTYHAAISVSTDEVADVTVNFLEVSEYIPVDATVDVEIAGSSGIRIESNAVCLILVPAYSTVDDIDLPDCSWKSLENSSLLIALHTLAGTGLEGLYKTSPPLEMFGNLALLKYPNIYVQMRAPDLGMSVAMTQECAKYVHKFAPSSYALLSNDTLVFKKYETLLYVPVKCINSGTTCKDLIPEGGVSLRLDLDGFLSRLSALRKLNADRCGISLYNKGLTVSVSVDMSSITTSVGDRESGFLASFMLPMQLAYICFRLLGNSLCEILYKEGVLCLRTPTLVIVVHVLS